jgi:hypothetical protein
MDNYVKIGFDAQVPLGLERVVNDKYVQYGHGNLHPQYLNSLVEECSVHQGVVNQKTSFIFGQGFNSKMDKENVFVDSEDADEIIEGAIRDRQVLGYSVLVYEKKRGAWYLADSDSEKWRFSEDGKTFFYSEDWSSGYQREGYNGYEIVPHYTEVKDEDRKCVALIISPRKQRLNLFGNQGLSNSKITGNIYPSVPYSGSIVSILAYIEMAHYDYAETVNGFVSNTLIQLNEGKPSGKDEEEKARKIRKQLQETFQDRKNKGGIIFHFNDSKESGLTIEELNRSQNIGKYNDTKKSIVQNIMIGHSVQNASLFGVEVEGAMGGTSAEEQLVAFQKFNKTYVIKEQKQFEKEINRSFKKLNGSELGFKIIPFEMTNAVEDAEFVEETPSLVNEDKFLEKLSKIGREKPEDFESKVLFSRSCLGESSSDGLQEYFTVRKQINFISDTQEEVLIQLKNGVKFSEIAKKLGGKETWLIIAQLKKLGLLDSEMKLTNKAIAEVGDENDFDVLYDYREIPNLPALKSDHRPLCKSILAMNKLFTREEIDGLGSALGAENLWRYRGGWYHNPVTKRNVHHCRHEWYQVIVKKDDN